MTNKPEFDREHAHLLHMNTYYELRSRNIWLTHDERDDWTQILWQLEAIELTRWETPQDTDA